MSQLTAILEDILNEQRAIRRMLEFQTGGIHAEKARQQLNATPEQRKAEWKEMRARAKMAQQESGDRR